MSAEKLAALELEHRLAKAEAELNSERTARLEAEKLLKQCGSKGYAQRTLELIFENDELNKQIKTLEARLAKCKEHIDNLINLLPVNEQLKQKTRDANNQELEQITGGVE